MQQMLKDKVIVITGGATGVGKAASLEFAKQGAKVVMGDIADAQESVEKIKAIGGEAIYVPTNLRKVADCKKLFDTAYETFGKIDGFFSYAGLTPVSPLDSCDEETFDAVTEVNYKAAFFCCQQAIKYMRMNGGGSIVLTGSPHAWSGEKDRCAYACTKGVLRVLNDHIAHHYSADGIRCNYLTLGWTPTEGELALRKTQNETEEQLRKRAAGFIPIGRMCEVNDYLTSLVLMLSDTTAVMTGSVLRCTGGLYM